MVAKILLKKEYSTKRVVLEATEDNRYLKEPEIDLRAILSYNEPEMYQWLDKENIEYCVDIERQRGPKIVRSPVTFDLIWKLYVILSIRILNDKDAMRFKLTWA
jgi:hypothetical protein